MENFAEKVVSNKVYQLVYFAVILILIIMIAWYHMKHPEGLIGQGLAKGAGYYGGTSGATMRRLAQGFSQPGQGDYNETHVDEIKEVFPNLLKKKSEGLVDTRQAPNFMEIGNELEAYQTEESEAGKKQYAETGSLEYLQAGSPVQKMEEAQLYAKLQPI